MATRRKKGSGPLTPSEEAHRQVMELLELGERSSNPDIRAAAIDIAKDTSTNQRTRSARVGATTIMLACTLALLGAAAACWYALIHYPGWLGDSISGFIVSLAIILVALYLLLSGHLSQDNFVKLCMSVWKKGKGMLFSSSRKPVESLSGAADTEHSATGDNASGEG